MTIEYALICWSRWVAGDCLADDSVADVELKARLKAADLLLEQAIDDAVRRLPDDLNQIIKLFYLERRHPVYCQQALGLDQDEFRLRFNLAKQLISSAVLAD